MIFSIFWRTAALKKYEHCYNAVWVDYNHGCINKYDRKIEETCFGLCMQSVWANKAFVFLVNVNCLKQSPLTLYHFLKIYYSTTHLYKSMVLSS